ncbi:MAG: NAD-dependent epimerase/dehydratase family protein [Pseudomonadota bacterium]
MTGPGPRRHVLLMGGSGRIGKFLVPELERRFHLTTLGRKQLNRNQGRHVICPNYEDPRAMAELLSALSAVDVFVHFGAAVSSSMRKAAEAYRFEVKSLAGILAALPRSESLQIIFASSYMVYGSPSLLPISETHPLNPRSVYGVIKVGIEKMLALAAAAENTNCTILRISGVYGFGNPAETNLIPSAIAKIRKKEMVKLSFAGEVFRDYVLVDDVVEAVVGAIERPEKQGVFNIGSGIALKAMDLVALVGQVLDLPSKVQLEGTSSGKLDLVLDINKATHALAFTPCRSLERGIKIEADRQLVVQNGQ